jgi:hypothetical protein
LFELKPHQETAVRRMRNGCILCGGVGVGKSHTAVAYYMRNEAPKPVYVITTAKKRDKWDWQTLWGFVGMHEDPELTMSATVKVDSWENIKKYEGVKDAFFIFDEQRLVGTGTWVKTFYKIAAANRWVMLSATPGDNWLDYVPVFRANGFIKNITQFRDDHCVYRWTGRYNQLIGYRQVPRLVKWRNQLLVDMPYEKHTTRHLHDVAVEYDKDIVKELVNKRWHVYENRPLTDASELFRVMRKVVYSDETRLKAVQSLLQTHPKLIVFYNFDYELEILRTLNSSSLTEIQTHQHSVQNNSKATDDAKNNPNGSKDLTTESSQLSTKLRTLANTQSSDSLAESQSKSTSPKSSTSSSVEEPSPTSQSEMTVAPDSQNQSQTSTSSPENTQSSETSSELTSEQSRTSTCEEHTSASTKSPMHSDTESTTHSSTSSQEKDSCGRTKDSVTDPWTYLLSPEGLRENEQLLATSPRSRKMRMESLPHSSSQMDGMQSESTEGSQLSSEISETIENPIVLRETTDGSETSTDSLHTNGSRTTPTRSQSHDDSSHSRSGEAESLRDSLVLIENPMVLSPEESGICLMTDSGCTCAETDGLYCPSDSVSAGCATPNNPEICLITDGPRSGYGKSSEKRFETTHDLPAKETNQCAEQSENCPNQSSTGTESNGLSSPPELTAGIRHRASVKKQSQPSSPTGTPPSDSNSQTLHSTSPKNVSGIQPDEGCGASTKSGESRERPSESTGSSQTTTTKSNVGLSQQCLRRLETLRTISPESSTELVSNRLCPSETLRTASPDRPPQDHRGSNGTSTGISPSTQEISTSSENTGGSPHSKDEHCETSSRTLQKATDEHHKEDEWLTKNNPGQCSSSTSKRKTSTSSEQETGGCETERPTGQSEGSTSPSTTKTSSKTSSGSQDPSWDGRSSTSSPQFQVAEWNGHKHEDVPITTSWVYLVQYVAGAEAWETTATDAMVFYSPPYSYKKYDQTFGRIDRLNTPFYDLHYYLLKADSPIDKAVFKSLESQKDFNEQGLREAMWGIGG